MVQALSRGIPKIGSAWAHPWNGVVPDPLKHAPPLHRGRKNNPRRYRSTGEWRVNGARCRWEKETVALGPTSSDGQIQIAIRCKSRLNHLWIFDLSSKIFDLNIHDSIGIRFEIHSDLIW